MMQVGTPIRPIVKPFGKNGLRRVQCAHCHARIGDMGEDTFLLLPGYLELPPINGQSSEVRMFYPSVRTLDLYARDAGHPVRGRRPTPRNQPDRIRATRVAAETAIQRFQPLFKQVVDAAVETGRAQARVAAEEAEDELNALVDEWCATGQEPTDAAIEREWTRLYEAAFARQEDPFNLPGSPQSQLMAELLNVARTALAPSERSNPEAAGSWQQGRQRLTGPFVSPSAEGMPPPPPPSWSIKVKCMRCSRYVHMDFPRDFLIAPESLPQPPTPPAPLNPRRPQRYT
jgi:hypothetical protein